ncbi:MAG: MarR family transcriptional regulator [Ignavibacteria bacterium]|nr:MarR family transcriptional regulator [Ignavibacteria bacterium]
MKNEKGIIEELFDVGQKIKDVHIKLNPLILKSEITITQWWALYCIDQRKTTTLKEFSSDLKIAQSSASGLINRLVKQNLVDRVIPSEDRRKTYISLTKKGRKILEIHTDKSKIIYERLVENLSAEEQKLFLSIMKKFYEVSTELLKEMNKGKK